MWTEKGNTVNVFDVEGNTVKHQNKWQFKKFK